MPSDKVKGLRDRVRALMLEKDAVLLVHNYQRPEIQDIADHIGDSFGLSKAAQGTSAKVIVFAGVDFMAESAKILNPEKIVLHPEPGAVCPMACMVDVEGLKIAKREAPGAAVVSYVNTSAAVKAESDYCCTSANALKVIKAVPNGKIIFVPDSNLGMYVKRTLGTEKDLYLWPGYCPTHVSITKKEILDAKKAHPDAKVIVHPECVPEVIDLADAVRSTEGMIKFCGESDAKEFIVGTEREMTYRLKKGYPDRKFYAIARAVCPNMKKITLQSIVRALETLTPRIEIPEDIRKRAMLPLQRMIEIGRGD